MLPDARLANGEGTGYHVPMSSCRWAIPVALFAFALACSRALTEPSASPAGIAAWGDSMTEGGNVPEAYPPQLAQLLGRPVFNGGISRETSTQILARLLADTVHRHAVTILWMGRNNFADPATVEADIAAAVRALGTEPFVVLSICNGAYPDEVLGTPKYEAIRALNAELARQYPAHFLDVRLAVVEAYDPAQPDDVRDHAQGLTPTSLREDPLHLNAAGNHVVAAEVARFLVARGW